MLVLGGFVKVGDSMALMLPPQPPPLVTLSDDDGLRRIRFRLWKLWATTFTILVTTWFVTLGPAPAIIALVVAKHVLVAILLMGLEVDARERDDLDPNDHTAVTRH